MRRSIRTAFVIVSVAAVSTLAFASAASAGAPGIVSSLTIVKTVDGPVPAGTTFTVAVDCTNNVIDDGDGGTGHASVVFGADGQPTTADTIDFLTTLGVCTVTETVNGGASSTTYACEGGPTPAPAAEAVAAVCPQAGPISTPITVNKSFPDIEATVTVHNTFVAPPPLAPVTPAAQVVATPVFTG